VNEEGEPEEEDVEEVRKQRLALLEPWSLA
jgi:hypothetical protein